MNENTLPKRQGRRPINDGRKPCPTCGRYPRRGVTLTPEAMEKERQRLLEARERVGQKALEIEAKLTLIKRQYANFTSASHDAR